jgi:hypothetical protein
MVVSWGNLQGKSMTLDDLFSEWEPIVYRPSNQVVTRPYGSMPFVRPAPHDKSLMELSNVCDDMDAADLHIKVLQLYQAKAYSNCGGWGKASSELGLLGKRGPSAEALRRDIRKRTVPLRKIRIVEN